MSIEIIDTWSTFKDLDDCSFSGDLKNLSLADCSIAEADIHDFCKFGELDVVEDDQGAVDLDDCSVVDSGSDVVVAGHCREIRIEQLAFIHLL